MVAGLQQLIRQGLRIVNVLDGFENSAAVGKDRASNLVIVEEIPGQRFDVAVEKNSYDFTLFVDRGRARVSADGVGGVDGVDGSIEFQRASVFRLVIRSWKHVGRLCSVRFLVFERSGECR